jgi:hypothetical protein
MAKRKMNKGKKVRTYIVNYYKHHKHKYPPRYIAGAVACQIREQHGRTCSPRSRRKKHKIW